MIQSKVKQIILETCNALWSLLQSNYLPTKIAKDWSTVADSFLHKYNFPNCISALDGRLIEINDRDCDKNLILFAMCDTNMLFTRIDIAEYTESSLNDLQKKFDHDQFTIPQNQKISYSDDDKDIPFFTVGSSAFPLTSNIMRPFVEESYTNEQNSFNSRVSLVHSCVTRAFDRLLTNWKILLNKLNTPSSTTIAIVKACIILHNFTITKRPHSIENEIDDVSSSSQLIKAIPSTAFARQKNLPSCATELRDYLSKYFVAQEKSNETKANMTTNNIGWFS